VFGVESNRVYVSEELGNGRSAALFASSTPHGELVAVAMAVADTRSIDTAGAAKLVTPRVRALMQRLAILMKPPSATALRKGMVAGDKAVATRKTPLAKSDIEGSTISELAALGELEIATSGLGTSGASLQPAPQPADTAAPTTNPAAKRSANIRPAVVARLPEPGSSERIVQRVTAAAASAAESARLKIPAAATGINSLSDAILRNDSAAVASTSGSPGAMADIALHVQQLMKLRSGGRTRRYEVLVRGRHDADTAGMNEQLVKALSLRESAAAIDRAVVGELVSWLKQHPSIWNSDPASFSVNLSLGSLLDAEFITYVAQALKSSGVAPDTIGFEVTEKAFMRHREACMAFMDACEKIGCYVVIDDFTMHSDVVPFLSSRALRVVKIDPQLTQSAMRDRLAQAMVIAISQASKVLGLHCVAKRIETVATRQWLAAVGIDFAQGFAIENPRPLDALAVGKAEA
jgi:EAL domain-containing protein (putative c-di-GMP-specific phosphodiesterase class I)